MKNLVASLILSIGVLTTSFAQKDKKREDEKMTTEQKTVLHLKKMILKLDLSSAQANRIKPLLLEQVRERKAMKDRRKSLKKSGKKLTAKERFEMKKAQLDRQIAFKREMKRILNEKQYERFEKKVNRKIQKMKKKKRKKQQHKKSKF